MKHFCRIVALSASLGLLALTGKASQGAASAATIVRNHGDPDANSQKTLDKLPEVLAGRPDHLVVFLAMNDAVWSRTMLPVAAYRTNLESIVAKAREAGVGSVALVTVHPVNTAYLAARPEDHLSQPDLQEHLAEYDRAVREVAAATGAILVDWRTRFLEKSPADSIEEAVGNQAECLLRCEANSGAADGIHLSAAGNRWLAETVARALRGRVKAGDTVACVGDGLTYGTHMEGEGTATGHTYPAYLAVALNEVTPAGEIAVEGGHYGAQAGRLATAAAPGWSVKIRLPDGRFQEFKSTASEPVVEEKQNVTVLTWRKLGDRPAPGLTVHLTRTMRDPGAAWHLAVEADSDTALWEVTFPDFQTAAFSDDQVLLPTVSGRLHPASEVLDYKSQDRVHYPSGLVTMQCAGVYGPRGGVYIGVHDPVASNKKIEIKCEGGRFELRWRWLVPDMGVPGKGWQMPGEVLIRPFTGDWFDIAQIYRAWAAEKAGWWPRGDQAGRPETPQWFKDNPVWIMSNGPWPYRDAPIPTDQAVAKIKKFAAYMDDVPCAVHWYNWHLAEYDNDLPHYFPTDEGFAEGVREVQAAGVRVMPYINAHLWDIDVTDFESLARPAAVKSFDGSIPTKAYSGNTFAPMCPVTPLWQKTVEDLVLRLAGPEIGAEGVYLDQVSAQASMECFDPSHGHPLGGGSWWPTQGYWPMLDGIRQRSPGTILTAESTAEPYVSRLDGYLTWLGYRNGASSVPLFHAVYAGQVQLFGRLYKLDSWKGVAMRAKTAQALVWGEQLGWIIPDVVDDPVAGPFLKRLARMRYELLPYLSRGQMARPPAIVTDGSTLTSDWVYIEDLMVTTPTVQSGAWKREDGKAVVTILVNADDTPRTVTVPFHAADHGLSGKLSTRSWPATEMRAVKPAWEPSPASWSRQFTLEPRSALAIEVEISD